jgi:hypothetical protein
VAMIPALLAVATPGEGAEGPDPNVTMLPGYRPSRPAGEAVSTGRLRVPLPLAADRPRGNEQVTMLPGRAPSTARSPVMVPAAFRAPATIAAPPASRRTMAIGVAILGVLLAALVGAGLLMRPGSPSVAPQAPASNLPASGHLNNGLYDMHFTEAVLNNPLIPQSPNLRLTTVSDPADAKDGRGAYLQLISPGTSGGVMRPITVTLDPGRQYTVSLDARSESDVEILGHLTFSAFGDNVKVVNEYKTPFCAYRGWTHISSTAMVGDVKAHSLVVNIQYVTKPPRAGVPFDITNLEYTFSSHPPTRDPAATPGPKC